MDKQSVGSTEVGVHPFERRVEEAVVAGYINLEQGKAALDLFRKSHDTLIGLCEQYNLKEYDRGSMALAISGLTLAAYLIGGRDPAAFSALSKTVKSRYADGMRAIKASRYLPREEIDAIIREAFQDKSLMKGAVKNWQRADRALERVNERITQRASQLGRKPTRYKDADSLRRRYETAMKRTAK